MLPLITTTIFHNEESDKKCPQTLMATGFTAKIRKLSKKREITSHSHVTRGFCTSHLN